MFPPKLIVISFSFCIIYAVNSKDSRYLCEYNCTVNRALMAGRNPYAPVSRPPIGDHATFYIGSQTANKATLKRLVTYSTIL